MEAYKLGRAEDLAWSDPILTFAIERHGGMAHGSTRAELQIWRVDLDAGTAEVTGGRYRQLHPTAPRLDVRPIAEEIVALVESNADDPRIRRKGTEVHPVLSKFLPPGGPKQTREGRMKRLRAALEPLMREKGWVPVGRGRFQRDG